MTEFKNVSASWPDKSSLGVNHRESLTHVQKEVSIRIFVVALFIVAKKKKQETTKMSINKCSY